MRQADAAALLIKRTAFALLAAGDEEIAWNVAKCDPNLFRTVPTKEEWLRQARAIQALRPRAAIA